MGRGRPTVYTGAIADEVCTRLAAGETLREICRSDYMPDEKTVRSWAIENRSGFSPRYARARDLQIEHWADELISIADDASNDWMRRNGKDEALGWQFNGEHVQRSRLRSDNRKWLLSKLKPERYGERVDVNSTATVKTVDSMTDEELAERMSQIARGMREEARVIDGAKPRALPDRTSECCRPEEARCEPAHRIVPRVARVAWRR